MFATTVDQTPKGQGNKVQNGSMHRKDGVNDDDFETYLSGQTNQSNRYPPMSDPYIPSYYPPSVGFSYSVGEAAWSTARDPPMPYLTPYGQMSSGEPHFIPDGMFSQPGALGNTPPFLGQHGFNFYSGSAEYSTWGTSVSPAQSTQSSVYSNSYGYAASSLSRAITDGQAGFASETQLSKVTVLNSIEQGVAGLKVGVDMVAAVTKTVGSPLGGIAGMSSMAANSLPPSVGSSIPKSSSWAAIAQKPAKPQPKVKPKANMDLGGGATSPPPPAKHNMNTDACDEKGSLNKPPLAQVMTPPEPLVQQPHLAQDQASLENPSLEKPHQPQHQHQDQHQPSQLQSLQSSQHPHPRTPGPARLQRSSQPGPPHRVHPHSPRQPGPPPSRWLAPRNRGEGFGLGRGLPLSASPCSGEVHPEVEKLQARNNYNPEDFDCNLKTGRVFVIKSYSEDNVHRSIKYSIWCSTEHGNKRLNAAYRSVGNKGPVYLLFSIAGSGHFCGVAEMYSPVDFNAFAGVWSQDKWKGTFDVKWIFIKDVPNYQLRHIRLENNDYKPVTHSRDTQEVPLEKAKEVLKIITTFKHTSSIFDDFAHYERREEEAKARKIRKERRRNKQSPLRKRF